MAQPRQASILVHMRLPRVLALAFNPMLEPARPVSNDMVRDALRLVLRRATQGRRRSLRDIQIQGKNHE